ncbi:MAG: RNA polymerase sigma factor [Planctomycetes bacterium]|nr:RNA polymerase sigma factor [Planctomycetota bacterium]
MPPESRETDREGFRRLFEAHRTAVHRLLARLCRDADRAEDLLQETFATLWRKRDQFRGEGSLEGYVRRIAYRTFLNARTRIERARRETGLSAEPTAREGDVGAVGDRVDRDATLAAVRRAVDALPDAWREPFVLFRYEGLSCRDVAEMLDLTPKAVELRLRRALEAVTARVLPAGDPARLPHGRPA